MQGVGRLYSGYEVIAMEFGVLHFASCILDRGNLDRIDGDTRAMCAVLVGFIV